MSNALYSGDPKVWESLSLVERLEAIRQDVCTGPCGQSQQSLSRRTRIDRALRSASALSKYESHWAVRNPGSADQYRRLATAALEALGLRYEDASPSDVTESIHQLKAQRALA